MQLRHRLPPLAIAGLLSVLAGSLAAQTVSISVDVNRDRVAISPYLYGKNDGVGHPSSPLSEAGFQLFRDAGVRMLRMNGGNNGTKYNWQKRITSHPDWYNNVYASADWDYSQAQLQQHLPDVQAMWCFQLLGKVADNTNNNFNDWAYNQSQWWSGVGQNLAGGGVVDPAGGHEALQEGNPSLYLTDTSAETSTAILDHWMRSSGLGLDRSQFLYWNMDNEPEIWEGTHDDVMPAQLPAEQFMQRYFEYAKRARARFPEIKLCGPVPANEWQWYNWSGGITAGGRSYPWLEYFIKRIGEEQARTGIRLLDVLDIHYYPGASNPADVVQLHRTFFDRSYVNPDANGVHAVNGGWDESITQEYIFGRCADWLDEYLGPKHGVTFGLTETAIPVTDAPLTSVWYASMLGEFMRHGVEVFTPWTWQPGMWEVLHLYSRYNGSTGVRAVSNDENTVSAYATIEETTGDLTIVLVNRALTASKTTTVTIANASLADGPYATLQLADLPATETFVSHDTNALVPGSVDVSGNQFSITLPALSITSVLVDGAVDVASPPGASRLANVSVRAKSGAGDDALIVGFFVGGTGSKEILLRGIGPSMQRFDIDAFLPDPVLTLTSQKTGPVAENDDWGVNAAEIAPIATQLGAFPLNTASLDAAVLTALPAGGFTARIADKSGGVGIALGEAYDADIWSTARLVNVSARTWVGPGDDALIAGFVVMGGSSKTLLVRAVGPGLSRFSVPGVLEDPVLRVFKQGQSLPLFRNDDWGSSSYAEEVAATAYSIGAFALAPESADSALLLTLPPGIYTAVATGANSSSGVALVEVYEVEPRKITTHSLEHYKLADPYPIHHPFPQAGITPTHGLRPSVFTQQEMNDHAQQALEEWVEHWITDSDCPPGAVRPHMGPGPGLPFYSEPYGTISEFVGWGMLLTVMMDNDQNRIKGLFNSLDAYRKAHLNEHGFMMSTVNYRKAMDAWNRDAATEADENMAMALLLAHYQWGSDGDVDYLAEATQLINDISTHLVERPAYALKPAVTWGGSDAVDPAYYDSIYYPLWFNLTGDATWTKLDENFRTLIAYFIDTYGTGLVPEWCKADGTATLVGGNGLGAESYFYGWDAHQVSTKWAIHYAWYGTARTSVFVEAADTFATWVKNKANGDLTTLVDAYTLDGTPRGTYSHLPNMVGAMGLSGTVSAQHQDLVDDAYQYLLTLDATQSYSWGSASAKVRELLVYSGNFVNFTDLDH